MLTLILVDKYHICTNLHSMCDNAYCRKFNCDHLTLRRRAMLFHGIPPIETPAKLVPSKSNTDRLVTYATE